MSLRLLLILALAGAVLTPSFGQTQTQPPAPSRRVIGEVQSVSATEITLKADTGETMTVKLDTTTAFLRVPPGETSLQKADKIAATDVKSGDRVLATARPGADLTGSPAARVVVMTKSALTEKQQQERAEWQRRGTAGTVTAIDPGKREITVTLRNPGMHRIVVATVPENAPIRRYSPESVRFSDATPSSLAEMKVGDQVRILGNRNEDGTAVKAEQVVFGTFHNIAGTVVSIDAAKNELRINNLETRKPLTVVIGSDTQVKRLPPMLAQMLAIRARNGGASAGAPRLQRDEGGTPGPQGSPGVGPEGAARQGGPPSGRGPGGGGPGGGMGARGGDPQQMLERLPNIPVTELKPGDAVIVASSAGKDPARATAITLLVGVEPLLSGPEGNLQPGAGLGGLNLNLDITP